MDGKDVTRAGWVVLGADLHPGKARVGAAAWAAPSRTATRLQTWESRSRPSPAFTRRLEGKGREGLRSPLLCFHPAQGKAVPSWERAAFLLSCTIWRGLGICRLVQRLQGGICNVNRATYTRPVALLKQTSTVTSHFLSAPMRSASRGCWKPPHEKEATPGSLDRP